MQNQAEYEHGYDLMVYMEIHEDPSNYVAWAGAETASVTSINLCDAAEEDAARFRQAWDELSRR